MINTIYTALVFVLAALPFGITNPTKRDCEAPYYQYDDNVPNRYIVNLTEGYTLQQHFSTVGEKFNVSQLPTGYYANLTTDLLSKVRADCGIQFVQDDFYGEWEHEVDGVPESSVYSLQRRETQQGAPWPLYQLSASQKNPTDHTYYYIDDVGLGVDVYIIDSGIAHPQSEFNDDDGNDRVIDFVNFSDDADFSDTSPRGHGTAVASAAAGRKYGVAKAATILNVKSKRNGKPNAVSFVDALNRIIDRHISRRTDASFKGSVVNMSFKLGLGNPASTQVLDRAAAEGLSLVASAGNGGYDNSNRYPSRHPDVIPVGATLRSYQPATFSNYGQGQVTVWAPGNRVPVCATDGSEITKSGTSLSSPYVAGILAIFYGSEGTSMNPALALTRLTDQTDDWVGLPSRGGQDWHNTPRAFANTGNRKGAGQNPPVKYINGPTVIAAALSTSATATATATATPSSTPTQVCQSPNHDEPLTSFDLDQGQSALADFVDQCQGVELSPTGDHGCIFYYNPCSERFKGKAVDVIMSVTQTEWADGETSTWPDVSEVLSAVGHIMNDCDTTTTSAKWGGYRTVSVDSGMRMYNVSANQNGMYPEPPGYHTVKVLTQTGAQYCQAWDSD